MSISKAREERFWNRWRQSGAVGNMETARLGKTLRLEKAGHRVWHVLAKSGQCLAQIYLDIWYQVDKLVLRTTDPRQSRRIKELVLWHASQHVRHRNLSLFGGLMISEMANPNASESHSDREMDFSRVSGQIKAIPDEVMNRDLGKVLQIVRADFADFSELLTSVLKKVLVKDGLTIGLLNARRVEYCERIRLTLAGPSESTFTFWHSLSPPRSGFDLYIVPDYHPVMKGWQDVVLVNGDTNAVIRWHEYGIDSICCPPEASTVKKDAILSTGWSHTTHPFYAQGQTFELEIDPVICQSQEAAEHLYRFLKAAANLDQTYIAISGGFGSPYDHPDNVRRRAGWIRRDSHDQARGSEGKCVWAYRTLEQEGKLDKAYIPPWFLREDWLGMYENFDRDPKLVLEEVLGSAK